MRARIVITFFLFCIVIGALSFRLMRIVDQPVQMSQGAMRLTIDRSRGAIFDRNGLPIVHAERQIYAAAKPSPAASLILRSMLSEQRWLEVEERLSRGSLVALQTDMQSSPSDDVKLLEVYPRYAQNQPAVHLIGYLDGQSGAGVSGLERAFDPLLGRAWGSLGVRLAADARGRGLAGAELEIIDDNYRSSAGIQLTIDLRVQRIAEEAMRLYGLKQGAVVVLDCTTGEVLALASTPVFDPGDIATSLDDPLEPFFNRALGAYPIGSTFKTFIAAAALDQRIPATRTYLCEGQGEFGGRVYRCSNETAHGMIDMSQALAQSCNLYFIQLATNMQRQPMLDLVRLFGFGEPTVLVEDLRGARGNIPSREELSLPGEMANFSFGQGKLLGTSLQMAAATACLVNGGVYRSPTLVKATMDEYGAATPYINDIETREVISPEIAEQLRGMLVLAVEEGTGLSARPETGGAGGKTATAQSGRFRDDGSEILQTGFAGFFPAQQPRYAVMVFRQDGVSGAIDCGPVFRRIANAMRAQGLF